MLLILLHLGSLVSAVVVLATHAVTVSIVYFSYNDMAQMKNTNRMSIELLVRPLAKQSRVILSMLYGIGVQFTYSGTIGESVAREHQSCWTFQFRQRQTQLQRWDGFSFFCQNCGLIHVSARVDGHVIMRFEKTEGVLWAKHTIDFSLFIFSISPVFN